MAYDRLVIPRDADYTHRDRLEVEVELRSGSSVRHVWVDHRDGLAVGSRVRPVADDVSEGDGWWTVAQVYGTRRVGLIDGIGVAPEETEQSHVATGPASYLS